MNASVLTWPSQEVPLLYSFRRCPYAMRARLALWASGLKYRIEEVNLKQKPADLWQVNPLGTVPVLTWGTGESQCVIAQSFDIMVFALNSSDPLSWKPQNPQTWTHLQQCLVLNDGVFKQSLDRYKYPNRYPDEDVRDAKMRATSHLMNYDAILEKQAFLSGPQMGLLDACVLPFVRQFAKTDEVYFQSQPWAALQRWLYGLLQSDGFLSIMSQSQV